MCVFFLDKCEGRFLTHSLFPAFCLSLFLHTFECRSNYLLNVNVLFIFLFQDYIVEKCEEGTTFWEKCPGVVNGTKHQVKDLEKGKKYKFRVKAQNMYGTSDPVETEKSTLAKNPYGKQPTQTFILLLSFR